MRTAAAPSPDPAGHNLAAQQVAAHFLPRQEIVIQPVARQEFATPDIVRKPAVSQPPLDTARDIRISGGPSSSGTATSGTAAARRKDDESGLAYRPAPATAPAIGHGSIQPAPAHHPLPAAASGMLTIELRSRLIRRVHYHAATHRMGVVMRTGRLVVYDNVPAELAVMLGRHPAPGVFYEQTVRTLLAKPRSRFSLPALSFRWRIRACFHKSAEHSFGRTKDAPSYGTYKTGR